MIEWCSGNLLEAPADALVNAVNCIGVMGKGIALQFKQAFRYNYEIYRQACIAGRVKPGKVLVVPEMGRYGRQAPRFVINFPTKYHYRDASRIEYIRDGLDDLMKVVIDRQIKSIALPALGCGLGGLDWREVKPMIESWSSRLHEVSVMAYPPHLPSTAQSAS